MPPTTACRPPPPGIGIPHVIPVSTGIDGPEDDDDDDDDDDRRTIPPRVCTLTPYGDTVHTLPPPPPPGPGAETSKMDVTPMQCASSGRRLPRRGGGPAV